MMLPLILCTRQCYGHAAAATSKQGREAGREEQLAPLPRLDERGIWCELDQSPSATFKKLLLPLSQHSRRTPKKQQKPTVYSHMEIGGRYKTGILLSARI